MERLIFLKLSLIHILSYFDDEKKIKYVPYVIEPSLGADRMVLALSLIHIYAVYCHNSGALSQAAIDTGMKDIMP